jgi:MFS family permease
MAIIAVSKSMCVLVTGRIIQGISSAIIQVVSVTVILACSPEDAVGQSMGYAGAAMNLGFLAGPLLGGVLYRFLNWQGLFGVVGGILALNLVVPMVILPVDKRRLEGSNTPTQSPLMTCSIAQPDALQATSSFSLSKLLREPKMRIGLYAVIVSGIFISAIDTVRRTLLTHIAMCHTLETD